MWLNFLFFYLSFFKKRINLLAIQKLVCFFFSFMFDNVICFQLRGQHGALVGDLEGRVAVLPGAGPLVAGVPVTSLGGSSPPLRGDGPSLDAILVAGRRRRGVDSLRGRHLWRIASSPPADVTSPRRFPRANSTLCRIYIYILPSSGFK